MFTLAYFPQHLSGCWAEGREPSEEASAVIQVTGPGKQPMFFLLSQIPDLARHSGFSIPGRVSTKAGGGSAHRKEGLHIPPVWTEVPGSLTGPRALLSEEGSEQAAVTMEFPAASAHRGLVPWLGLLLAVFPSCLPIWIPPTTAKIAFVSTGAAEGQDVILPIRNSPRDSTAFMWYRGTETEFSNLIGIYILGLDEYLKGPGYSGRESANLDGSLLIRNLTTGDEGLYRVVAHLQNNQKAYGLVSLSVYMALLDVFGSLEQSMAHILPSSGSPVQRAQLSEPILLASSTTVKENEDAVEMTCCSNMRSTYWLFNGTRLQLNWRMTLSQDDRILTINPVRREDAGNYQCKISNPISSAESDPVVLKVKY
ncbi:hypothetical protein QTO34_010315 [Cnephaeus nilssonii]|uniref:Ig-like domain-containing protein n=1 Tax=Cnephaeus nilssonii TaxID=3371016 RepID=A0AA40HF46_CNENI|nr:hypothetical protein QTO34_010315 [Eptesicus nilssonii]